MTRRDQYYAQSIVDEVDALLATSIADQPIGVTWNKIRAVFDRENIGWVEKDVHVSRVLPHPRNRNGIMLNGFNARATASKVLKVGANRGELHGAVSIEFSPFEELRQQQMKANVLLANRSKGMIAPVTGNEDRLSLGTGHAAGFGRSAIAKQVACFSNLSDKHGNIDLAKLKEDPDYKKMLEVGWDWFTLPWKVEATWPVLPEFAQRALNASNAVSTDATEIEVALIIGDTFCSMETPSWIMAQDAAKAQDPPCVHYIEKLTKLVELFSGGVGHPLLIEQEEFSKTLGEAKRLGEGFVKTLVDVKFPNMEARVHVRQALLALKKLRMVELSLWGITTLRASQPKSRKMLFRGPMRSWILPEHFCLSYSTRTASITFSILIFLAYSECDTQAS